MNKSETIGKLAEALAKAQGAMPGAIKDSSNPYFKSRYADLESVWEACRKPLSDNGLAVMQLPVSPSQPGAVAIETTLAHVSGEWVSGTLEMTPVKNDPQGIGSCITYIRRYALQSAVGIAPADDDGNAASGKQEEAPVKRTFAKPGTVIKAQPTVEEADAALLAAIKAELAEEKKPAVEMCTADQKLYLITHFRDALRTELQPHADQLRRDFLKLEGYMDEAGEGTSDLIPRKSFKAVCAKAIKHAGEL